MKQYVDIFKTLLSIDNNKRFLILQLFLSAGLYKSTSLLPPIATAGIIAVATEGKFSAIWFYVILFIVFYVAYFLALRWNYWVYTKLANYYKWEIQRAMFDKVAADEKIFKKIPKGKLLSACSDDVAYLVDVADCAATAFTSLAQLIVIFFIFMTNNILVAVLVMVLDLVYLHLMNENSRKASKFYAGTRKYDDKMMDIFSQVLGDVNQVKTLNLMPKLNANIDKMRKQRQEQYNGKRKHIMDRYTRIPYLVYAGKIVLYILLVWMVINGNMTIDKLVLLVSYFEMVITGTDQMLESLLNMGDYGVRLERVKAILDFSPQKEIDFGDLDNDRISGSVVFRNVSYVVDGQKALKNASFEIQPKKINTIVGHSGAGKTTVINLLYRLVRLQSGSILIDNESIYNYSKDVYASNVSGVYRTPFVFDMSIKDNLALVDDNEKHQIEACKRVGIHKDIMALPKGYNTIISADAATLSDGQKQLLAIARALLSKAEILLFDEITSIIDPKESVKVGNVLLDLKRDHTIIAVTHRPQMMEISDRIIVLKDGKVVAEGKNKEVYEHNKLYQELRNAVFASVQVKMREEDEEMEVEDPDTERERKEK